MQSIVGLLREYALFALVQDIGNFLIKGWFNRFGVDDITSARHVGGDDEQQFVCFPFTDYPNGTVHKQFTSVKYTRKEYSEYLFILTMNISIAFFRLHNV